MKQIFILTLCLIAYPSYGAGYPDLHDSLTRLGVSVGRVEIAIAVGNVHMMPDQLVRRFLTLPAESTESLAIIEAVEDRIKQLKPHQKFTNDKQQKWTNHLLEDLGLRLHLGPELGRSLATPKGRGVIFWAYYTTILSAARDAANYASA